MKKVKTKKKRNSIENDEFMKWFIPARSEVTKPKLPHEYIFIGKLYKIILNCDKWHKENYSKSIKEYIMQDYLQYLKEEDRENEILEIIKIENYTDKELLEYANKEKIKNLKENN